MSGFISTITLGVDDLERSVAFYREGFGLPTRGIQASRHAHGLVAFFELPGGQRLALWPRSSLAGESGLSFEGRGSGAVVLSHNLGSEAQVDALLARAVHAGATAGRGPGPNFYGGYAGWLRDPDGHLWEIVFHPRHRLADAPSSTGGRLGS